MQLVTPAFAADEQACRVLVTTDPRREELLKEVWGPSYAKETHYLRVYLAQLRRKLEDDPSHPRHLLTEAGMGYRFEQ